MEGHKSSFPEGDVKNENKLIGLTRRKMAKTVSETFQQRQNKVY
jgi:hypothetical protein